MLQPKLMENLLAFESFTPTLNFFLYEKRIVHQKPEAVFLNLQEFLLRNLPEEAFLANFFGALRLGFLHKKDS